VKINQGGIGPVSQKMKGPDIGSWETAEKSNSWKKIRPKGPGLTTLTPRRGLLKMEISKEKGISKGGAGGPAYPTVSRGTGEGIRRKRAKGESLFDVFRTTVALWGQTNSWGETGSQIKNAQGRKRDCEGIRPPREKARRMQVRKWRER